MADFTINGPTVLIPHSHVQHPDSVEGTIITLTEGYLSAAIDMYHAFVEATVNTDPGRFSIFGSRDASAKDTWKHLIDIEVTNGTPVTEDLTNTEGANTKVLRVASTTDFTARENIYVRDTNAGSPTSTTGALASGEENSEWHRVDKIVTNTSVDIMVGIQNQKDSSDELWDLAQQNTFNLPPGYLRVRVDFSHEGTTGANVHVKAELMEITDIV